MLVREKLRSILRGLMWPLLARTRHKIRARQQTFAASPLAQLISCTGELPPITVISTENTPGCQYSKRLALAIDHYAILKELPSSREVLFAPLPGIGVDLRVACQWLENSNLQLRYPLPFRARQLQRWWQKQQSNASATSDQNQQQKEHGTIVHDESDNFLARPFGVNLIGHAFDVFGIGEDCRAIAGALQAAAIPFCVINYASRNGSATTERKLEEATLPPGEEGPFAFNLISMAAPSHARWFCEEGLRQQKDRYTIVSWPWEMQKWPLKWESVLQLADEAWPFSSIIEAALKPYAENANARNGLHMTRMPAPAELEDPDQYTDAKRREATRRSFGLPLEDVLFVFSFDLNSTMERKNPMAVLDAFKRAFDGYGEDKVKVGLVIKALKPAWPNQAWETLKEHASKDPRLHIIEASLKRSMLLALYGCCDCFVSLHRAEGLGRGHAEALQLGLDVIVTDYSSTADFCTGPLAYPVRYKLIPVEYGEYFDYEDQVWADADIDHAAERLRQVAEHRLKNPQPDRSLAAIHRQRFSSTRVGRHYRQRLEELWAKRQDLASSLKGNRFIEREEVSGL